MDLGVIGISKNCEQNISRIPSAMLIKYGMKFGIKNR